MEIKKAAILNMNYRVNVPKVFGAIDVICASLRDGLKPN
jgi:hypothetical protein